MLDRETLAAKLPSYHGTFVGEVALLVWSLSLARDHNTPHLGGKPHFC